MKTAKEILTSHNKFHINLGLQRIKLVLALLDNPQKNYKIIHVAGTNGKGSTCKTVNQILIEHFKNTDKKIGLFTSPHLFSYCERIKINNVDIKEEIFDRLVNDIDNFAKNNNIELSEFELITAVALHYFYIQKVDYVILEVGLGGKYDATNVVNPIITAITTIDLDHTERLGDTIGKITLQKAGIIKKNVPIVISKDNKGLEVIKKVAELNNSKVIEVDKNDVHYNLNLLGEHQKENTALALAIVKNIGLDIKEETIKKALNDVNWKFRLEYDKNKNILIDGAHNPSGIKALRDFLDKNFKNKKKIFLFGCLKNKDYKTMLDILIRPEDKLYFYEFNYPNALKFEELDKKYGAINAVNPFEILKYQKDDELKIFCGSLYMLGKIFNQDS
mgnify:CR=1 FL=1